MLIKCPECGGQVSDRAAACPHCGAPVESKPLDVHSRQDPVQIDVDAEIVNVENAIEECRSLEHPTGNGLLRAWYVFEKKVKPTKGRFVDLADRVAISVGQACQEYFNFVGDFDDALNILGQACRIAEGESARKTLQEGYRNLIERRDNADKKYGKRFCQSLESLARAYHVEIGNGDVIQKCCKTCKYSCYRKSFLFKTWLCSYGSYAKSATKEIALTDVCKNYTYRYPTPESLSKKELLKYGIVRYALSQGFSYVYGLNIMEFGKCKNCKYFRGRTHHMLAECSLRGFRGEDIIGSYYCPSFSPLCPQYYVKIRD